MIDGNLRRQRQPSHQCGTPEPLPHSQANADVTFNNCEQLHTEILVISQWPAIRARLRRGSCYRIEAARTKRRGKRLRHPAEQDLIDNWAKILFNRSVGIDRLMVVRSRRMGWHGPSSKPRAPLIGQPVRGAFSCGCLEKGRRRSAPINRISRFDGRHEQRLYSLGRIVTPLVHKRGFLLLNSKLSRHLGRALRPNRIEHANTLTYRSRKRPSISFHDEHLPHCRRCHQASDYSRICCRASTKSSNSCLECTLHFA